MMRYSGIDHLKDELKSDSYEKIFSAQSFQSLFSGIVKLREMYRS